MTTDLGLTIAFAPALAGVVLMTVGTTASVWYGRVRAARQVMRAEVEVAGESNDLGDSSDSSASPFHLTIDPAAMAQLAAASDQFFDEGLRSELVKLEAREVLRDLGDALGLEPAEVGSRSALLEALARERAQVARELEVVERVEREVEELQRLWQR